MSKVALSYALFGDPNSFEFPFYFRGAYFNARMNEVLYPDAEFNTVIHVAQEVLNAEGGYRQFFEDLEHNNPQVRIVYAGHHEQRCKSMLWRFGPIFTGQYDFVLCRDLDSVSTYREACCVYEWYESKYAYHAINDNDAHGGLMGGMVGFTSVAFKSDTLILSFDQLVHGADLRKHGSDQNLMNKIIHPRIGNNLLFHVLKGAGASAAKVLTSITGTPKVHPSLWVTDLISRYIGSAGVIDFELLRFLRGRPEQVKWDPFEKKHANLLYWVK
jgi:hypothetical protein